MMRVLIAIGLTSLAACGPGRQMLDDGAVSLPLIYGGEPVAPGEHEAVVGLAFADGDTFRLECTGTLIAPDVVLTAGHCLKGPGVDLVSADADLSKVRIYTGLGEEGGALSAPAAAHAVARAVAHPSLRAHPLGYADWGLV